MPKIITIYAVKEKNARCVIKWNFLKIYSYIFKIMATKCHEYY